MRCSTVEITEHRQPLQIATRRKNDFDLALIGTFKRLGGRRPEQHPVLGIIDGRQRCAVARIDEIKTRIKYALCALKCRRTPARPRNQLHQIRRPSMPCTHHLQAVTVMQLGARIRTIGWVGNTGQPKRKSGLFNRFADCRQPRRRFVQFQRPSEHRRIIEICRIDLATRKHRSTSGESHRLHSLDHQQQWRAARRIIAENDHSRGGRCNRLRSLFDAWFAGHEHLKSMERPQTPVPLRDSYFRGSFAE